MTSEKRSIKPAKEGYRMPAEWEPHAATWLTWPHDPSHWPRKFHTVEPVWAQMVKELETGEDVHICMHDAATQKRAEKLLKTAGVIGTRVHMHHIPNNWSWTRDHGPIFLKNDKTGDVILSNWRFNGWGEKWSHDLDDDIPVHIGSLLNMPIINVPMVLEGGSIDVNGKGTLLTTTSCLLHENRNPQMEKGKIEQTLSDYLGVRHFLWLDGEIAGDDTNGHIDDQARFVDERTIIAVMEENEEDENFAALQSNREKLSHMKDQDGISLTVIELPLPKAVTYENTRLPLSYANFYIGNDVILMPIFDDENDAHAMAALKKAFPQRRIATIDARDLFWGFGAFHCITQQQPV